MSRMSTCSPFPPPRQCEGETSINLSLFLSTCLPFEINGEKDEECPLEAS